MRKLIAVFLIIVSVSAVYASTVTPDDSFPDYALAAIGRSVDASTRGRGNLDIMVSSYSEDDGYFPDMLYASFTVEYGDVSTVINAVGHDTDELSDAIEDEILSEIEARDTTIMMKNQELELKNQELESKSQELESKSQELSAKNKMLANMIGLFRKQGLSDGDIAKELNIGIDELSEYL